MNKKFLIVNEKLNLRLADEKFADPLYQILASQKDYLRKWLGWVQEIETYEDLLNYLKTSRLFNHGGQKLITFIFFEEKLVGSVALVKIWKENNSAELGYWIIEEMQGKGIVSQCCQSILDYAFEEKGLHRIELNVEPHNKKSIALAEKMGFQLEGRMRDFLLLNEEYHDLEKYSLLESEWK